MWMAWVQRPSGLIKVEGSASAFRWIYLGWGKKQVVLKMG
jgi:hypothetical protein